MRRGSSLRIRLRPERDVAVRDGRTVAQSEEPWLKCDGLDISLLVGRFVEITFRASLLDEPARPIFRFRLRDGSVVDRIGVAPIVGAGIWTGRVPEQTCAISASPTNRRGPFDFLIERVRLVSSLELLGRGFRSRPKAARSALLTRLIGWKPESDVNLAWAISSVPLGDYTSWHAARARPLDPGALDRPRFAWSAAAAICIVVIGDDAGALQRTLASLVAQVFPCWGALVLSPLGREPSQDSRIETISAAAAIDRLRKGDAALTCVVQAGSVFVPHALAYVAEQAHRFASHRVFAGDCLVAGDRAISPVFKPGRIAPVQTSRRQAVPSIFVRNIGSWSNAELAEFLQAGLLPSFPESDVKPLRRILMTVTEYREQEGETSSAAPRVPPGAMAAIIILTRDHPALLSQAVTSIRARTATGRFRIFVVDNGSATSEAKALLAKLARDPDVVCLEYPGAFDFSAMCNAAAEKATADILVFLNDDTEVLSDQWLDRLMGHALDPAIGAVGAKLTYPDGRLQHIGVLVGMGGSAGHFGALDAASAPGWTGRNRAAHAVSAVTGACLAVAREKFFAVGGFDAEHLPVELSDVDLCLKLNARGWQTIVDPSVHLLHQESASRGGATFRRLTKYETQRAIFVERWRHVLRDDPCFHPGLSLYSWQVALG